MMASPKKFGNQKKESHILLRPKNGFCGIIIYKKFDVKLEFYLVSIYFDFQILKINRYNFFNQQH